MLTFLKDLNQTTTSRDIMNLEKYFKVFRENTIGYNHRYQTPYGQKTMLYADWIASGRLYLPIEKTMINSIGPFIGNTHTETS
ncbi:MAG: hypothetical protein ABSE72_10070, partial [Bacteroidales bacterium]